MNELNIFFTETETTSASSETVAKESEGAVSPEAMEGAAGSPEAELSHASDAPILTIGAVDGETAVLYAEAGTETAAPTGTTEATQANLGFEPMNFVDNLQYMGIGMLTIFLIIGAIILTTTLINWIFSRKKDK